MVGTVFNELGLKEFIPESFMECRGQSFPVGLVECENNVSSCSRP